MIHVACDKLPTMGFLRALRNGEDDDVDSLGEVAELIGINMYKHWLSVRRIPL